MATAKKKSSTTVVVCFNSFHDRMFRLAGGRTVTLHGVKVSSLVGVDGRPLGSQYGRTVLPVEDWEALKQQYGRLCIFERGLVFEERDEASSADAAADRADLRNGLEPVNVETDPSVKSTPADTTGAGA
jgi:hypothetical protein